MMAAMAGSIEADTSIEGVLGEHGQMLSRIAASYEANPARREDLLQEISLAIWRALPRWRGEASLRTFVAKVAHNRAVSHVVSQARRVEVEMDPGHPDHAPGPDHRAEDEQQRERLVQAVHRLPLGQRQVVVMALEGFSQRETGHVLGLEENTVAQRLSRARRQLHEWLGARA